MLAWKAVTPIASLTKSEEYGFSYNPLALLFLPGIFPRGCFPSWEAEGEMGPQASVKGKVNMGKSPRWWSGEGGRHLIEMKYCITVFHSSRIQWERPKTKACLCGGDPPTKNGRKRVKQEQEDQILLVFQAGEETLKLTRKELALVHMIVSKSSSKKLIKNTNTLVCQILL